MLCCYELSGDSSHSQSGISEVEKLCSQGQKYRRKDICLTARRNREELPRKGRVIQFSKELVTNISCNNVSEYQLGQVRMESEPIKKYLLVRKNKKLHEPADE